MQTVIYKGMGPEGTAIMAVEERPIPKCQHPRDVVVK